MGGARTSLSRVGEMSTQFFVAALYIFFSRLSFSYSISITSEQDVHVYCEPDSTKGPLIHGASCLYVKGREGSCNGDFQFEYGNKSKECFGKGTGKGLDISEKKCISCPNEAALDSEPQVTWSFIPINLRYYTLSITVNLTSKESYVIYLDYKGHYCFCMASNETELNLTLVYSLDLIRLSVGHHSYTFQSPQHCADYKHIPYDGATCGLPQLEKPRNIVLQCNETHTKISWEPACYMYPGTNECVVPDQVTYYLTIRTGNFDNYFAIHNTTAVTVNVSPILYFGLYAYSHCSGFYQYRLQRLENVLGCSKPAEYADSCSSNCAASNIFTPTPSPSAEVGTDPTSSPSHNNHLAVYIAAGVAGLVILITALVVIVVLCKKKGEPTRIPRYVRVQQECDCSVLVVYSSSTPELETMAIMQKLGRYIQNQEKGIGSYLQDTRKPQDDLIGWITDHHQKADAVFCVVNEEFSRDWENSFSAQSSDSDVAVRTLRQLFEGELQRGPEAVMKYAVVLPKPSDKVFIPAILLNQCRFYMSDTERLASFVRHGQSSISTAQV